MLLQNCGECTAEAGMIFSDIISGLERVSDHATNIAFYLLDEDHVERQKEKREDRWKDFWVILWKSGLQKFFGMLY